MILRSRSKSETDLGETGRNSLLFEEESEEEGGSDEG